jgi:6-phosphogluconate dehydrogenase (decarboxylating)
MNGQNSINNFTKNMKDVTQINERDIVKSILEYLEVRGIMAWRNNAGILYMKDASGKSYGHKMGPTGSPDIIGLLHNGIFLGIECKKPGNKATDAQKNFLEKLSRKKAVVMVATSIDDVISELDCYYSDNYIPWHERE